MDAEVIVRQFEKREEVMHAYADHTNFEEVFKPTKQVILTDGLLEMAQWTKKNGASKSANFDQIEIQKNLPESWKNPTEE